MERQRKLTRDIILQTLIDALEPRDYVHAFWEGGAAAFERLDEWSDIDLYLVVDDEKIDETFLAVEEALRSLSPIERKYEVLHPPSLGLSQAFYKLEGASEYLLIDLAVLRPSSPDKFLEPEMHGKAVFYFNKSDEVKPPPLDKDALVGKLQERLDRLKARFAMFNSFVQKEINRGNHLEAMDFYRAYTLGTLVEAMRIKYNPFHYNFRMHYIHYELPSEIVKKLEHLYFVKDGKDLQEKYNEATKWFHETISEIDQEEIERQMKIS
jgi:glycosyltransferase involved in cell wall biosynthesis